VIDAADRAIARRCDRAQNALPMRALLVPTLLAAATLAAQRGPDADLVVAFWNVENLFDADDDPANAGDDEFTPAHEWTEDRYRRKLANLAQVIAAVRPHALGLAEVENRRVLEDLVALPALAALGLRIVHRDSPDKRGIDLALAYRAPFELPGEDGVHLHAIDKPGAAPTRGVLEVPLRVGPHALTVLVNHWPSRGSDGDGAFRAIAGKVVRGLVQRIGHDADVLLVGDFNDDPFDRSITECLGAVRSRNAVLNRGDEKALFNASWPLLGRSDEGTYYFNRDWVWNVFDQIIVSRGLLDAEGLQLVEDSMRAHAPDALRDEHRRPRFFRKTREGWSEGYSDHFLVLARLRPPGGDR
jgi:endonuclease/exonuclease/phosphatase family metal-dependent hydrolase